MPSQHAKWFRGRRRRLPSVARLRRLASLLGGGILLQGAAGGCEEYLSAVADALGQPLATGIGNGLSNLAQAIVIGLFV